MIEGGQFPPLAPVIPHGLGLEGKKPAADPQKPGNVQGVLVRSLPPVVLAILEKGMTCQGGNVFRKARGGDFVQLTSLGPSLVRTAFSEKPSGWA